MIVWKVIGKLSGLFCAVFCATVVQSAMDTTYNSCLLVRFSFSVVTLCVSLSLLDVALCVIVYLCTCALLCRI